MNKLLFSILALCLSFGAMSQKDCHISGKMDKNKAGQYVYLTYGKQVLDSAMVQEDASFEIRTKAENKLCSLLMKGDRSHGDDDVSSIFGAVVSERSIFTAGDFAHLFHIFSHYVRESIVVFIL